MLCMAYLVWVRSVVGNGPPGTHAKKGQVASKKSVAAKTSAVVQDFSDDEGAMEVDNNASPASVLSMSESGFMSVLRSIGLSDQPETLHEIANTFSEVGLN